MKCVWPKHKSAHVKKNLQRFDCECGFVGVSLVPMDEHQDIPKETADEILRRLQQVAHTCNPFQAPPNTYWKLTTFSNRRKYTPFFSLFPFDCSRVDGAQMNNVLQKVHNWSYGRIQYFYPFSSQLSENEHDIYFYSPCFAALQHVQLLIDVCNAAYERRDWTYFDKVAKLVKKSFQNLKTTSYFRRTRRNLVFSNYLFEMRYAILNDRLKQLRDSSNMSQFCNGIISLYDNCNMRQAKGCLRIAYLLTMRNNTKWMTFEISQAFCKITTFPDTHISTLIDQMLCHISRHIKEDLIRIFLQHMLIPQLFHSPNNCNQVYTDLEHYIDMFYSVFEGSDSVGEEARKFFNLVFLLFPCSRKCFVNAFLCFMTTGHCNSSDFYHSYYVNRYIQNECRDSVEAFANLCLDRSV